MEDQPVFPTGSGAIFGSRIPVLELRYSEGMSMTKLVTLTIDDQQVTVALGTLIVDAAKKIGKDIPVFCYHPKLEPVGMCRMCLVEVGRPIIDRSSGQVILDVNNQPKLQIGPKLETACTTPVSAGMVVRTNNQAVEAARKEILEFILTSHPLDCPVCDKGGECPLQNLTMGFGPGESRFLVDDKIRLAKRVPLGELIYLDRERCIQCARCVRFQEEIADDPVIGFYNRGRQLEIVTYSEPGFDSIFSGNTTDICPVGALTTADFRFGARPWELKSAASLCTQCPVGCNITLNVRREARAGGNWTIKRVMPRQNEEVNEIWICDKGRFSYHFSESNERLTQPLVRKDDELVPVNWDEALDLAAAKLQGSPALVTLVGGRLSNEDLFNLRRLTQAKGGRAVQYSHMAGGELVGQYGLAPGSNFSSMGSETAILVIASDLHQEAPVWWLRVKQAAERGALLIVVNPRSTRLDRYADHLVRYAYGDEQAAMAAFLPQATAPEAYREALEGLGRAQNLVVIYGSEGLGLAGSQAFAQTAAGVVVSRARVGQPNNGLLAVWAHANTQGAWDNGFYPAEDLPADLRAADVLLLAAADPAGDDPDLAEAITQAGFVIVQDLFLTASAQRADLVLPAQAFTEREGTYTSGERRVQRFFPAVPARPDSRPDYAITAQIGQRLGLDLEGRAASLVQMRLAAELPAYNGLTYQRLSEMSAQWPIIARAGLYYGGTSYENTQGLGVQLPLLPPGPVTIPAPPAQPKTPSLEKQDLLLVPVTRLYDRGTTITPSGLLSQRLENPAIWLNPQTAEKMELAPKTRVQITSRGWKAEVDIQIEESIPPDVGLVPRSVGLPVFTPMGVMLTRLIAEPEA